MKSEEVLRKHAIDTAKIEWKKCFFNCNQKLLRNIKSLQREFWMNGKNSKEIMVKVKTGVYCIMNSTRAYNKNVRNLLKKVEIKEVYYSIYLRNNLDIDIRNPTLICMHLYLITNPFETCLIPDQFVFKILNGFLLEAKIEIEEVDKREMQSCRCGKDLTEIICYIDNLFNRAVESNRYPYLQLI